MSEQQRLLRELFLLTELQVQCVNERKLKMAVRMRQEARKVGTQIMRLIEEGEWDYG